MSSKVCQSCRSWILVVGGILVTILAMIVVLPVGMVAPFSRVSLAIEKMWSAAIVKLAGIRLTIHGLDHIKDGRPYIFVSNHQSMFDIPVLMYGLPRQVRMIHKKELLWIPVFGQVLMALRFISIDRGRHERAQQSLRIAAKKIREGVNIVIFADGTRSLDGELHPLKRGAFVLAIDAQVDIIPVTISGTINVLHKMQSYFQIGFNREVRVIVGEPVSTQGLTVEDKGRLRDVVQSVIEKEYASVRHLSDITDPFLRRLVSESTSHKRSVGGLQEHG